MRRSRTVLLCNSKSRKGGRTFPSHANTESEKVSAWVRRAGWRVCVANGLAKLRCSPRVNGGKARQGTVSVPKGMRGGTSGVEQTKIIPKMEGERKLKEERIGVATMENEQKTKADWIVKQRS